MSSHTKHKINNKSGGRQMSSHTKHKINNKYGGRKMSSHTKHKINNKYGGRQMSSHTICQLFLPCLEPDIMVGHRYFVKERLFLLHYFGKTFSRLPRYCLFVTAQSSEDFFFMLKMKGEGKNNRNFERTPMVLRICNSREDWMIFKGPGFLAVVWFGSSPTHLSLSKLDRRHTGRLLKRDNLMREEVGRGWV